MVQDNRYRSLQPDHEPRYQAGAGYAFFLKISSLSIQTAGYSGQAVPEIRIEAVEYAEELRELIRNRVRLCSGRGDGTGICVSESRSTEKPTDLQILDELKKIRSLLEQKNE